MIAVALSAAALLVMVRTIRKNGAASAFRTALLGAVSLFLLHHIQGRFGLDIPINLFNLSGSIVLGIPFLICLVVIRMC